MWKIFLNDEYLCVVSVSDTYDQGNRHCIDIRGADGERRTVRYLSGDDATRALLGFRDFAVRGTTTRGAQVYRWPVERNVDGMTEVELIEFARETGGGS